MIRRQPPSSPDEREGERDRRSRRRSCSRSSIRPCTASAAAGAASTSWLPERRWLRSDNSNRRDQPLFEIRRQPRPGDRGAEHGGEGVVAADDPRQVRVDAEQHRDAIQVEDERERDARCTVCRPRNGEKPRSTPSAKAAAVRSGVSSTCSSASSQRRISALREMNHRK